VQLSTAASNDRSVIAYRKAGFVTEVRLRQVRWLGGAWAGEIMMSVLEPEWRAAKP
jgi:RimJ/RimL family protein N-acetyltransferase